MKTDSVVPVLPVPSVPQGEMVDDWYPLSGQEGEEKEGVIHLILSIQVSLVQQVHKHE